MNDVKSKFMYNGAKQAQNRPTLGMVGCNFSMGSKSLQWILAASLFTTAPNQFCRLILLTRVRDQGCSLVYFSVSENFSSLGPVGQNRLYVTK